MNDCKLLGVVLCGGRSSRMGRDKNRLTLRDGTTFLDHACRRLKSLCPQVYLSGVPPCPAPVAAFADRLESDSTSGKPAGPVAGIVTMLELAQTESFHACLVTPVDMPWLSCDDLRQLIERWHQFPQQPICSISQSDQQLQPLVAIYPVSLTQQLRDLARSDDRSLTRWLRRCDHQPVCLSDRSCTNINTPTDLSHGC